MRYHGEKNRTKHEEGELNIYTKEKLLSFPTKVNNNNNHNNNRKKTKQHLECNCWVCKILDSSSSVIDKTTTAVTKRYEAYNLVSETGDSIFYDPLISSIFNNQERGEDKPRVGQIYIAVDRILDFVQQDELLAKHINGVNLNKNEY